MQFVHRSKRNSPHEEAQRMIFTASYLRQTAEVLIYVSEHIFPETKKVLSDDFQKMGMWMQLSMGQKWPTFVRKARETAAFKIRSSKDLKKTTSV